MILARRDQHQESNWTLFFCLSLCRTYCIKTHWSPRWKLHPYVSEPRSWPAERIPLQETPLPLSGGAGQEAERNRHGQNPHSLNMQVETGFISTHRWGYIVKSNTEELTSHLQVSWFQAWRQQEGHLPSNVERLQICQWISDLVEPDVLSSLAHSQRAFLSRWYQTWELKQQFFYSSSPSVFKRVHSTDWNFVNLVSFLLFLFALTCFKNSREHLSTFATHLRCSLAFFLSWLSPNRNLYSKC